jgi:hypothetical protein
MGSGTQKAIRLRTLAQVRSGPAESVQYAVGTVLNQIWEEDFLGFSYGFRPGRGQHDALDALWVGIVRKKVSFWTLISDPFSTKSSIVGWSSLWNIGSEIDVWSA